MQDVLSRNHKHTHSRNRFAVIPTAEKLGVDSRYSGRGVRIAFIDSGFYPHPDFAGRVVDFHDVAGEERSINHVLTPGVHHWHGTQTVTACAGDGNLSDGIYRGLAHNAELVLVKVSREGRIGDKEIEAGLRWVLTNRLRLSIRVLNISLGADCDLPTATSRINSLIDDLTTKGVVVTVAAGNSAESRSVPPASAPTAITVGGYNDQNQFSPDGFGLYHSSHGATADGLIKPELIAPAMFVAAPILPGTNDYQAAEMLSMLLATPNYAFGPTLDETWQAAGLNEDIVNVDRDSARQLVEFALRRRKIVAAHYQHVDGTSFAAPIVASVIALMLEANPTLSPSAIKNILLSTSKRLGNQPAVRQGFGIIDAPSAIDLGRSETHVLTPARFGPPRLVGNQIALRFHNDSAKTVSLSGDFNGWTSTSMRRSGDGLWEASIEYVPSKNYRYKFLVDGERWTEDPSHGRKEDDGFGGFNSVLVIE